MQRSIIARYPYLLLLGLQSLFMVLAINYYLPFMVILPWLFLVMLIIWQRQIQSILILGLFLIALANSMNYAPEILPGYNWEEFKRSIQIDDVLYELLPPQFKSGENDKLGIERTKIEGRQGRSALSGINGYKRGKTLISVAKIIKINMSLQHYNKTYKHKANNPYSTAIIAVKTGNSCKRLQVKLRPKANANNYSELAPGNYLIVKLQPEKIKPQLLPSDFDTYFYCLSNGIYANGMITDYLKISKLSLKKIDSDYLINDNFLNNCYDRMRYLVFLNTQKFQHYFSPRIEPDIRGLIAAMGWGYKSALSPKLKDNFAKFGLAHILVVSGSHLLIISSLIFRLNQHMPILFKAKTLLNIILLFLYAALCDFTPTVTRAFLMALILLVLRIIKIKINHLQRLSLACYIMLLYKPVLIYNLGFQMSVVLTAVISMTQTPIYISGKKWNLVRDKPSLVKITIIRLIQSFKLSLICQLAVLPFLIKMNAEIVYVAILLQVLLVPIIFVFTLASCLGFIVFGISQILNLKIKFYFFTQLTKFLAKILLTIVNSPFLMHIGMHKFTKNDFPIVSIINLGLYLWFLRKKALTDYSLTKTSNYIQLAKFETKRVMHLIARRIAAFWQN